MKKPKKDNPKKKNSPRDAPKNNDNVDKLKSKLVHSEDYKAKIIKANEKFQDKILEKDSKLIHDNDKDSDGDKRKTLPKRLKLTKKSRLATVATIKNKLIHSEDYKAKVIKANERYNDKLKEKDSKLIHETNKNSDTDNEQTKDKKAESKSKYKKKNFKEEREYTRTKDKESKKNAKSTDSSTENLEDAIFDDDKKLKKYNKKHNKFKDKLSRYGKFNSAADEALKAGAKSTEIMSDYLSLGRENAGVESAERTTTVLSKLQHSVRKHNIDRKSKLLRKTSKLENKITKRKSKLEFRSALKELKEKEDYKTSSAIKKFFKRKRMKNMIAKKYETRLIDRIKKSFFKASKVAKEIIIKKVKGFILLIAAFIMLLTGMFNMCSLGGITLNNSTNTILTTNYLANDSVLAGINDNFTKLENDLVGEIADIEVDHPGYDEYVYIDTENVGHSIYELFAYITSKCGGPRSPSEVQPDLVELFNLMYQLEFKEKVEIRTRTVQKEHVDELGRIVIEEEQEEYEYKTLITTLKFKTIGQVAQEVFKKHKDNLIHYNTLMKTKGNAGLRFANKELIQENGGVVGGGQEYEASDDIQKRIVDSCYITPSPGKGWCAMWVSQVYQNAGLGYIGGNANDLYRRYAFTSDPSKLKVGMLVMVESSSSGTEAGLRYGHVGIYIGDGKVMDNVGRVRITTLDNWIKTYCKNSPVGFGFPPSVQH